VREESERKGEKGERGSLLFRWYGQQIERVRTGVCVGEVCVCVRERKREKERETEREREKERKREREGERTKERKLSVSMARAAD